MDWIVLTLRLRRFLSKKMAEKYDVDVPPYPGIEQLVEVPVSDQKL